MASSYLPVIVIAIGVVAAFGVYSYMFTDEETSVDVLSYSEGVYSYSVDFSSPSYEFLGVQIYVDGNHDSGHVYNLQSSGDISTSFTICDDLINFSFSLSDYSSMTFGFEILDGEDHVIEIVVNSNADVQSAAYADHPYSKATYSFELAADGTSTDVVLLLSDSSFISTLAAAIVFVLFVVAALMLYASGGRR